ncbi:MAG: alpha/beta fold hydrolase, partial [Dehalococcoidia bacterium]
LTIFTYAALVAHKITQVERVPVTGHPHWLGLPWEDVTFPSRGDGVSLSGWYLPTAADDRCIVLIQGTEHHRNSQEIRALRLGRDLFERGFSVFLFDFRARGKSEGDRSSEGDREQWDVFGAIDYVTGRGIPVERIGLLGFSLGAGVALLVAAQEPRIPAVVSDSGFMDYMLELQNLYIGSFRLPSWFAIFVAFAGRIFFKADFSKVRPAQVVEQVDQPIFFIHGEDDPVIPVEETLVLHNISDNPEDRIWIVPRAEHVNVYRKKRDEYVARVSRFFHKHIV